MCGTMLGMRPSAGQLSLLHLNPPMNISPVIGPDSSQGACKSFAMNSRARGSSSHHYIEPTSVLDLRSPSPTSSTPSPGFQGLEGAAMAGSIRSLSVIWDHTPKRSNLGPTSSEDEVRLHSRNQVNRTRSMCTGESGGNVGNEVFHGRRRIGSISVSNMEESERSELYMEHGADESSWHGLRGSEETKTDSSKAYTNKTGFLGSSGRSRGVLEEGQLVETRGQHERSVLGRNEISVDRQAYIASESRGSVRISGDLQEMASEAICADTTQGSVLGPQDFQSLSSESMDVDPPASAFAIEELESMLLMSPSPAPDSSLMKWLLGDSQMGPAGKLERGAMVDQQIDFDLQDSWSSNLQQSSATHGHSAKLCSPHGLLPKPEPEVSLSRSMAYNQPVVSVHRNLDPVLPAFPHYPPRVNSSTSQSHPSLSRMGSLRNVQNPPSFPVLARAPSLPRLPSEMNFSSLEGQLSHLSSPVSFTGPSEAVFPAVCNGSGQSAVSHFFLSNVSENSLGVSHSHAGQEMFLHDDPVSDNAVTKSTRTIPSSQLWQAQQSYLSSISTCSRLQGPAYSTINSSSNHPKLFFQDKPKSILEESLQPRIFDRQREKPLLNQPWVGDYSLPHSPSPKDGPLRGAPPFSKNFPFSYAPYQSAALTNLHWRERLDMNVTSSAAPTQIPSGGQGNGGFDSGVMAINLLLMAAEEVDRANMENAQGILVRLNRLVSPRGGKSLHRVSFYFMEALIARISPQSSSFTKEVPDSPADTFQKVNAYKRFCEISPLPQFAYFTSNQAILEAIQEEELIHVIDFEVGQGVQWASFLQEIAMRSVGGKPPKLRLTVVGTLSHQVHSTGESLCQFARALDLSLDFRVVAAPPECLTVSMLELREGEAVAVNFVLSLHRLLIDNCSQSFMSVLNLVKEIRPKVVTVVELEANHNLPLFHERFVEALQYYTCLFDSLSWSGHHPDQSGSSDVSVIERYLLAPEIVNIVSCEGKERTTRHEKMQLWSPRLKAAGLHVLPFSERNTLQAECLLSSSKLWSGSFEIVKDEGSFFLSWQGQPLMAASAWGC